MDVKLPTVWTDEEQRRKESEKKVRKESEIREDHKVVKSQSILFFQ